MDKREKKVRYEEIMSLIADNDFEQAAYIADGVDWRREKFSVLMNISKLYRLCGRSDDALELMLMAYDSKPGNKKVVYGLCDLYLERKDRVKAAEFFSIYKHMDPDSAEALILNCRLIELCGGSIASQIQCLEDLKRMSPSHPEWRYQLAYLYHRVGDVKDCVETCDDIFIWFQSGPFVVKALELKMLHKRLSPEQQRVYDRRDDVADELDAYESDDYTTLHPDKGMGNDEDEIQVKLIDQDKFNTVNLSKELAKSMAELLASDESLLNGVSSKEPRKTRTTSKIFAPLQKDEPSYDDQSYEGDGQYYDEEGRYEDDRAYDEDAQYEDEQLYDEEGQYEDDQAYDEDAQYEDEQLYDEEAQYEDDQAYDEDGQYEDEQSYDEEAQYEDDQAYDEDGQYEDEQEYDDEAQYDEDRSYEVQSSEIEKGYEEEAPKDRHDRDSRISETAELVGGETFFSDKTNELVIDIPPLGVGPAYGGPVEAGALAAAGAVAGGRVRTVRTGHSYSEKYFEGDDGQLSLGIPEQDSVEKQITGQMTLGEELDNWEEFRQKKEAELRLNIEKNIKDTTGPIFADFEKKTQESLSRHADHVEIGIPRERIFEDKYDTRGVDLIPPLEEVEEEYSDAEYEDAEYADAEYDDAEYEDAEYEDTEYAEDASGTEPEYYEEQAAETDPVYAAEAETAQPEPEPEPVSQDTHGTTIWKEVDAAIRAEKHAAAIAAGDFAAAADIAAEGLAAGAEITAAAVEGAVMAEGAEVAGETAAAGVAVAGAEVAAEAVAEVAETAASGAEAVAEAVEEAGEAGAATITGVIAEASEESEPTEEEKMAEPGLSTDQMDIIADALETDADKVGIQTASDMNDDYTPGEADEQAFSDEELDIFSRFLYSKKMRRQILSAIDEITLAACVGNAIITGDEQRETRALAKALLKEIQLIDGNFDEKRIARVSGSKMNTKDVAGVCTQLENGALVIEEANDLEMATLERLTSVLENTEAGIVVILIDDRDSMDELIADYPMLTGYFSARIDMPPLTDGALVDYATDYAFDREYMIDSEKAVLALHQRIDELQIGEHNVTLAEVEHIVDEAIERSKHRPVSSFFEILGGKRYDNKYDMVVLKEKDFQR